MGEVKKKQSTTTRLANDNQINRGQDSANENSKSLQ